MKKLLAVSLLLFLVGCSSPSKKEASQVKREKPVKERVCSDSTVLATGRGIEITLADYNYTLTLLNSKAKEFFKEHPVDLLRRMVNRRLVVLYAKESGLAERYGLEKEMEDFKRKYLSPDFRRMYTEYSAAKAVELFRKELLKKIELTDDEVKEYYEKHKSEFKMPARVKAVVFFFSDKKRAKEAEKLLEEGRPWKKIAYRFGQFNAREKTYFRDTKDPIGVALFAVDEGKERKPIIIALSHKKYALVYPIKFIPEGELPLRDVKKFVVLKVKEEKLREVEREKLKGLWKKYGVKLENLNCIKGGA